MKILVYGGGAVGLGIASCLLKAGQDVTILARPASVAGLKKKGLIRTGIFGDAAFPPERFRAVDSLRPISDIPFDYILVATKSFASETAASDIQAHPRLLGAQSLIVLFQNGWGNAEIFARYLDPRIICNARVITGFIRQKPHHVDITVHADAIHIGSLFGIDLGRVAPLCAAIARGDIPCSPERNIAGDLWAKMLFNCPLNSVGAVCGVTYGVLGKNPWARKIMDQIILEIFQVMAAAGYSTAWETPAQYLDFFYNRLIPRTATHHSSTLQDLRAGKPTEIDALNGAVVRLGKRCNVKTPVNETIYHLVKFIEENKAG